MPKLTAIKTYILLSVCWLLLCSCSSSKRTNSVFNDAIIGENEMVVLKRLGVPTRVEHISNGGKVMIYESTSKGMFLTPYNKPAISYNFNKNMVGERQGITYTSNTNTAVNDPKYTVYPNSTSYFKVYINKHGDAVRIEQNMSQEQLEIYHERFKHFKTDK
jgi:hypothetical protein